LLLSEAEIISQSLTPSQYGSRSYFYCVSADKTFSRTCVDTDLMMMTL